VSQSCGGEKMGHRCKCVETGLKARASYGTRDECAKCGWLCENCRGPQVTPTPKTATKDGE
jgi:hypothetical protein